MSPKRKRKVTEDKMRRAERAAGHVVTEPGGSLANQQFGPASEVPRGKPRKVLGRPHKLANAAPVSDAVRDARIAKAVRKYSRSGKS